MLTDIQSALRAQVSDGAHRVGPFLIHFDQADDHPFRNYAIPDDGAQPSPEDVAELVAEFNQQHRKPRLEYVTPAAEVDAALSAAGFTVDLRLPLMTLSHDELRHPGIPSDVDIRHAVSDRDIHDTARVQNIAYGGSAEVTEADVARLHATNDGGVVLLAHCAGEPAGAGLFVPPRHGLAEVAAVGVLEEFRGRGIATALTAELSIAVFARGATPYLQCESHNEVRVYGRIGYSTVGEMVAVSLSL